MSETSDVRVRDLTSGDRAEWEPLWRGFLHFYDKDLDDETIALTWARLTGDGGERHPQMGGLAAVDDSGRVLGCAHWVVGPNTWDAREDCYLEDLFVDPQARGRGVGRALIGELIERGRGRFRRLHWITDGPNETAQRLYDRVAVRTNYIRYEIDFSEVPGSGE